MSITLRRKMFKLGGETNTHGIGITSGLEYRRPGYNAGGQVEPQATFGVGNNANKMIGPDGKVREANALFAAIPAAAGGIGRGLLSLGTPVIRPFLRSALKRLGGKDTKFVKGGPSVSEYIKYGTARGLDGGKYTGAFTSPKRIQNLRKLQMAMTPSTLGLAGLGAATGVAERAGMINPPEEDDRLITELGKGAAEFGVNFNPLNLASRGAQMLFGDPKVEDRNLYDIISGRDKAEEVVGSDNETDGGLNQKDISPAMETALTQEEQFAKMKADADARAEMYYAMLGGDGPNKVRALADAFTNAGALYDEDKSQALAGFSQGIQGELDRDEAVRDEARRLGLQEVVGLRDEERMDAKSRKQMVEQAKLAIMTSADMTPEQRQSTLRGLEAFELGVVDLLPTNDKGDEIDTGGMSPGSIYLDVNGITDGKYVAVSNDSNDPNQVDSFNNISEAEAHARS